ncbi:MAG: tRNA (adenosine(37)-N6)-threonylcarbamoyltransferase complex ATPase subunit type 1 TsaE [Gemmataceae bacterium]
MAIVDVKDLEETLALARRLGERLFPGAVLALEGTLGAGKTHFVRGVAEGLGIADSRVVSSPTFVLIQEYDARLPIYHFDAYRLPRLQDFIDLGVHEYFAGQGVSIVEWADKVTEALPPERLWIRFELTGPTSRRLTLLPTGEKYDHLVTPISNRER